MSAHTVPATQTSLHSISIIGKSRLGTSLAQALITNPKGFRLHSFLAGRTLDFRALSRAGGPQVLIIATRDADIERVAKRAVRQAGSNLKLIVHLAGSRSSTILPEIKGISRLTLHPIQTFMVPNSSKLFQGITFGVSSQNKAATIWAKQFVKALGGKGVLELRDESLPLYHAMIVIGANFITLLESMVEDISSTMGLDASEMKLAMAPLMRHSLENAIGRPAIGALTGPLTRGDAITIRAHRKAIASAQSKFTPQVLEAYNAFIKYGLKKLRAEQKDQVISAR